MLSRPISSLPISGNLPVGEYTVAAVTSAPAISFKAGFEFAVAASTATPAIEITATLITPYSISCTSSTPSIAMSLLAGREIYLSASTVKPSVDMAISSGRALEITSATKSPALSMSILRSAIYGISASTSAPSLLAILADPAVAAIPSGETTAWCVNMTTGGHTRYTDFPDASDTAEIQAEIRVGVTDFGSVAVKYVHDLYAHCRVIDGDLTLDTITDEHVLTEGYYMEARDTAGIVRRRVKLAKGVKGMNWQFIVKNVDGCDFTLQSMEVSPIQSARHK